MGEYDICRGLCDLGCFGEVDRDIGGVECYGVVDFIVDYYDVVVVGLCCFEDVEFVGRGLMFKLI